MTGLARPAPRPYKPDVVDGPDRGFLYWAKTHARARFELTGSGAPSAGLEEIGGFPPSGDLEIRGTYGDPELIEALAAFRGVAPERVLPVCGTSMANFIALACSASANDRVLIETPVYDPLLRAVSFLNLVPVPFDRRPDNTTVPISTKSGGVSRPAPRRSC